MVEEALVAADPARGRTLRQAGEAFERDERAPPCLGPADPAIDDADRPGGQREADRGDAAKGRTGPAIGDEAGLRVGDVVEEAETAFLQVVDQRPRGTAR